MVKTIDAVEQLSSKLGGLDSYRRADRPRDPELLVINDRGLVDAVQADADVVPDVAGGDRDMGLGGIAQHERGGIGQLQGIAQLAARRRNAQAFVRDPDGVVETAGHNLGQNAGAVVADAEAVGVDLDANVRGDAAGLAGVETVVDQLFK